MSGLREYLAKRPASRPLSTVPRLLSGMLRRSWYYLVHTLRPYEPGARPPTGLTLQSPSGSISQGQLRMCERLASQAADRLGRIEQKATTILSVIALLAPLSASTAAFIALNRPAGGWLLLLGSQVLALLSLLLASIAVMRALQIREHEGIGLGGLIENGAIRQYSVDSEGRGLMYVATLLGALTDHIADFVRASQLFLWLSIVAQLMAGALAIPLASEKRNEIMGTVSLSPATMQELSIATSEGHLASRVDSLALELARVQETVRRIETGRKSPEAMPQIKKPNT